MDVVNTPNIETIVDRPFPYATREAEKSHPEKESRVAIYSQ
jgi:hypothetical protein